MKGRVLSMFMALVLIFCLAACGSGINESYEVALITDIGDIDDRSYNQALWEGIRGYSEQNSVSCRYYRPAKKQTDEFLKSIDRAVSNGAKIVICCGSVFEKAVEHAQQQYNEVSFVLMEGDLKPSANTCVVNFSELEAGFLAGYAAVKEGFTSIGFQGGEVEPAVIRYGFGYIQGAEYAARELDMPPSSVTLKYNYAGSFDASPELQARAELWYEMGTQVIFACTGSVCASVIAAAESAENRWVVGSETDMSGFSETVISSAEKCFSSAVYTIIEKFYAGEFPGGESLILGADRQGIGLETANSRWKNFEESNYKEIMQKLSSDTDGIRTSLLSDSDASDFSMQSSSDFMAFFGTQYVLIELAVN